MPWLEFSISCSSDDAEQFEEFFIAQGALAVTLQDMEDEAIFEPEIGTTPLWEHNKLTALFDINKDTSELYRLLKKHFKNAPSSFIAQALEDRDWEREWLKHYQSMRFGEKFWVVPNLPELKNSLPEAIKPDHTILLMDPGLAFGTGTHETTALCLEWLANTNLNDKTIVDYGCGSGILAVAASLLGTRQSLGCDLDPQAILASKQNALRNTVEKSCSFYCVEEFRSLFNEADRPGVDIVVANILAGALENLSEELANILDSDGMIVLSGILQSQAEPLIQVYQRYFKDFKQVQKNDWVRIEARKR